MHNQINHECCRTFKRSIIWLDGVIREFKFNTNSVHRYFPNIILYLPLKEWYTCHFHVTAFVTLSTGRVKSTLTLRLVLILPPCLGCIFWMNSVYSGTFLSYTAELRYPIPPENRKINECVFTSATADLHTYFLRRSTIKFTYLLKNNHHASTSTSVTIC